MPIYLTPATQKLKPKNMQVPDKRGRDACTEPMKSLILMPLTPIAPKCSFILALVHALQIWKSRVLQPSGYLNGEAQGAVAMGYTNDQIGQLTFLTFFYIQILEKLLTSILNIFITTFLE